MPVNYRPNQRRQSPLINRRNINQQAVPQTDSRQVPYRIQYWSTIVSIITGVTSIALAAWAIWITIDLAQKDETDKDLKEMIKYTLEQNAKLDSQVLAQNAQIFMLTEISERSLQIAKETNLINRSIKNQSEVYNISTTPNIIPISDFQMLLDSDKNDFHLHHMSLRIQNEGLRHAKDLTIQVELLTIDSLGKESISVTEEEILLQLPSRASYKWVNNFFIYPNSNILCVKVSFSLTDPVTLKMIKTSLYYLNLGDKMMQVVNKKNILIIEKRFLLSAKQKHPLLGLNF